MYPALPANLTGELSGPSAGPDVQYVREVSCDSRRLCVCGHTYYLHGDRAVCACGGYELRPRETNYEVVIRCNCKYFKEISNGTD